METTTLHWISNEIRNRKGLVRTKKSQENLIGLLEIVSNFTEGNQNITKKELTKIKNSFDNVCGNYYGLLKGNDFDGDNKYDIYNQLAANRGFKYYWDAKEKNNPIKALTNFHVNGLVSTKHNLQTLEAIAELNQLEEAFVEKYYPSMNFWFELYQELELVYSILNPTKEQKEIKRLEEVKGSVNINLRNAVDEIAENFRIDIEKNQLAYYKRMINLFETKLGGIVLVKEMYSVGKENHWLAEVPFLFTFNKNGDKVLKTDALVSAVKNALEVSQNVILAYQLKMYDKLGGEFMNHIKANFETNVSGYKHSESTITFTFEDGSRFDLQNQIVHKYSKLGTPFVAFPTTFHDAVLGNGQKVNNPDEYSVKKAFTNYYDSDR